MNPRLWADYLIVKAQQHIEGLQSHIANLQARVSEARAEADKRSVEADAKAQEAERRAAAIARSKDEEIALKEKSLGELRRLVGKLRGRLRTLRPPDEELAQPNVARERRTARGLDRLIERLQVVEKGEWPRPPKPVPPPTALQAVHAPASPAPAPEEESLLGGGEGIVEGFGDLGSLGDPGQELGGDDPVDGEEDPLGDDDDGLGDDGLGGGGGLDLGGGGGGFDIAPLEGEEEGVGAVLEPEPARPPAPPPPPPPAPAQTPALPPAAVPGPPVQPFVIAPPLSGFQSALRAVFSAIGYPKEGDSEEAARRLSPVAAGCLVAGTAILFALASALRPRSAPRSPPPEPVVRAAPAVEAPAAQPPAAPAPARPQASISAVKTRATRALETLKAYPVGQARIPLQSRLESPLAAPGSASKGFRWEVGACPPEACLIQFFAGIPDPASGDELLYLFEVHLGNGGVKGLNGPAKVMLNRR
ncbi:MAG: hypothetical protein HY554_01615 [Elusimicrobia bacterium]|nr:hypothetical protein [Elusimicrobiota bacterium]